MTLALEMLPFVSKEVIRRHKKQDAINHKALHSYMQKVMLAVEEKVSDSLPKRLAIVCNKCSGEV